MLTLFISLLIPTSIVLLFRFINKVHKPPLFGVYQQMNKNYWIKFVFILVVLIVRQFIWRMRRAYAVEVGKSCDGTKEVHVEDTILEQKYDLGNNPLAGDATVFNGLSKDGNAITFAFTRRQNNVCDIMVFIKVNGEEYLSPNLPDTYLKQNESDKGEFKAECVQIEKFIPMRTWKLTYNGEMRPKSVAKKTAKVHAELTWSALFAPFNYDYQMSPWSLAGNIAQEPWSRDYFRNLKKFHQTHYEQVGSIKGTVNIDGKEYVVKMPSFRGRTFGKLLDWRNLHRYVFHSLYLDNGDCVVLSVTSLPLIMSHISTGFVCRKSDQAVIAVQTCDFKLYYHAENQEPPKNYGFTFKAGDKRYTVQVMVDHEDVHYAGHQREAKFFDRWLTVDVNGVKGRGFGQWMYNVQASNTYK